MDQDDAPLSLQDRFAIAYVANKGNARAAATAAGYKDNVNTTILLSKAKVQQKIAEISKDLAQKYKLTADLAAENIYREMMFDPACLFKDDGSVKPVSELDADTRMALSSVDVNEDGTVKYKWASKAAARNDLMKHLGMFERDNAQKGENLSLLIKLV